MRSVTLPVQQLVSQARHNKKIQLVRETMEQQKLGVKLLFKYCHSLGEMKRRYSAFKKIVCPHCLQLVCQKTFQEHKRLYYNPESNEWMKESLQGQHQEPKDSAGSDEELVSNVSSDYPDYGSLDAFSEPDSPALSDESVEMDLLPVNLEPSSSLVSSDISRHSSSSEEWDETDVEDYGEPSTSARPVHAPVRESAFIKWMAILILAFQSAFFLPNAAAEWVLLLLRAVVSLLSVLCPHPFLTGVLAIFPASLYLAWKRIGLDRDEFERLVVCPKCNAVYAYSDAVEKIGARTVSKRCTYIAYPNHSQARMRCPCNATLMKSVTLKGGKQTLVPKKIFPYRNVVKSLEQLIKKSQFLELCEQWRKRHIPPDVYTDVYDGKLWNDFQKYDDVDFLAKSGNLALMLNVDWFQPFKDSPYSVGVVYLAIMNLPREERFKRHNVILVSIIPGPKEPSLHLNTFLKPLINDLLLLWDGVEMSLHNGSKKLIRAALLCVACDIPAGKKVCGFRAFGSDYGCSRCFHKFLGLFGEKNYADFKRHRWPKRNNEQHRKNVKEIMVASTHTRREELEKKYGCRYSVLLKLPYYDAIRMSTIVDPLHNMYLGTAKHILKSAWLHTLSEPDLKQIQSRVDLTVVSSDIGRIPRKIASNFSTFTGDQWKNWTNLFSLIALNGFLSGEHLECWRHFVLASRIICSPSITKTQLIVADTLLLRFCERVVRLYGDQIATPNMHLHCHLRECIEDYGPVHSFWLFSFERYNGLFGRIPTNNKSIEIQLMRRFLNDSVLTHLDLPEDFHDTFESLHPLVGKPKDSISPSCRIAWHHWELMTGATTSKNWEVDLSYFLLPKCSKRGILNQDDQRNLTETYRFLYPHLISRSTPFTANVTLRRYERVDVCGQTYGSLSTNSEHSCYILANWNDNRQIDALPDPSDCTPGRVLYYALHSIVIDNEIKQHLFARVQWYLEHPRREALGKPLQIWHNNLFYPRGPSSFIPVQRIANRFTYHVLNDEQLVICPYIQKLYF